MSVETCDLCGSGLLGTQSGGVVVSGCKLTVCRSCVRDHGRVYEPARWEIPFESTIGSAPREVLEPDPPRLRLNRARA